MSDEILTDVELFKAWEAVAPYDPTMVYSHGFAANAEIARLRAELAEKERVIERISDFLLLADCDCPDWCSEQQRCGFCSINEIIDAALASGGEQGQGEKPGSAQADQTDESGSAGGHPRECSPASPDSPVCSDEVRAWIQTDLKEWKMHKREDKPEKVGLVAAAFTNGVVAGLAVALQRFNGPKPATTHGGDFTPIVTDREEG